MEKADVIASIEEEEEEEEEDGGGGGGGGWWNELLKGLRLKLRPAPTLCWSRRLVTGAASLSP
jgi:hypothetical protein